MLNDIISKMKLALKVIKTDWWVVFSAAIKTALLQVTLNSAVVGSYVTELSNPSSTEYQNLKTSVEASLTTAYNVNGFAGVAVQNFWQSGSNIAAW